MSSGQECRGGFYNTPQNAIFCDRKKNSTLFCCFSTPRPLIFGFMGTFAARDCSAFLGLPVGFRRVWYIPGQNCHFCTPNRRFLLYIALLHDGFQVLWELEY